MRRFLTAAMITAGIALMVVSYVGLSAPWGAWGVGNSDPRLPFAPALFILGVVLTFGSALVYEILPERDDRRGAGTDRPQRPDGPDPRPLEAGDQ